MNTARGTCSPKFRVTTGNSCPANEVIETDAPTFIIPLRIWEKRVELVKETNSLIYYYQIRDVAQSLPELSNKQIGFG